MPAALHLASWSASSLLSFHQFHIWKTILPLVFYHISKTSQTVTLLKIQRQSMWVGVHACYGLNCTPPISYTEALTSSTSSYCCCSVAKSCLTFCDPMDYSPSGSSVHGISQARILARVATPFSRGSSQPRDLTHVSCISRRTLTLSHQC